MIYFVHLGYDGSKYSGWQFQPDRTTVQGILQEKLKAIFKRPITVYGCGRTDSGVHASGYMMHIHLDEKFDFDLKFRLNKNLPDEIAIYDIIPMEAGRHSRYDATYRTYDYFIHTYKDPVLTRYSSCYEYPNLDFEAMKEAALLMEKYEDFRAICKQPDAHNHTKCKIINSRFYVSKDKKRMRFTITGNRFLRSMIRLTVTHLLDVGRGKRSLENFEKLLIDKQEILDQKPAYSNGLYLSKVEYPYIQLPSHSHFSNFLKVGLE